MAKTVVKKDSDFSQNIADAMFDMLVSGSADNREIARLQEPARPREYELAIKRIAEINRAICEQVEQLIADTLFEKQEQHVDNKRYAEIFTTNDRGNGKNYPRATCMFNIEQASCEGEMNLPLLFLCCFPMQVCFGFKLFSPPYAYYAGGDYKKGSYIYTGHIPHWVSNKYIVYYAESAYEKEALRKLENFKQELSAIMTAAAERHPQYVLLQEIAARLKKT